MSNSKGPKNGVLYGPGSMYGPLSTDYHTKKAAQTSPTHPTPESGSEPDELRAENDRLKEALSYLPKIPTQPYEREMAQEIARLREALERASVDMGSAAACNVRFRVQALERIDKALKLRARGEG